MKEDRPLLTESLLIASIFNYAGFLTTKLLSMVCMSSCSKEKLHEKQESVTVFDPIAEIPSNCTALTDLVERGSIKDGSNILKRPVISTARMASFTIIVWDTLMCCDDNREMRVTFLSIKNQNANAFKNLFGLLAETDPALKGHRCQEGHLLIRTILLLISCSLFNGFGSNLAKDVTSDARKKFSVPMGLKRVD